MKKKYQFMMVLCCFFQLLATSFVIADATTSNVASGISVHPHPSHTKLSLNRVISLFHHESEKSEYSSKKIKELARAISSFQPSLVISMLPGSDEMLLNSDQVEAFYFLRKEIMASNPHCKIGVTLHISKYGTAAALITKLQEINTKVTPDLFVLVVPKNNEVVYPTALAQGIEYIHAQGQAIGYQGPTSMIPDGVDFIIIHAEHGEVHREEISSLRLKHHLPILVQVGKSFWNLDAPAVSNLSKGEEQASLLTRLAESQNAYGYHFIYPVLAAMNSRQHEMHDLTESSILVRMRALMTRFN
jgi:hypothetical protein